MTVRRDLLNVWRLGYRLILHIFLALEHDLVRWHNHDVPRLFSRDTRYGIVGFLAIRTGLGSTNDDLRSAVRRDGNSGQLSTRRLIVLYLTDARSLEMLTVVDAVFFGLIFRYVLLELDFILAGICN